MKLEFNPVKLKNDPQKYFKFFEDKVTKKVKGKQKIDFSSFSKELHCLGDAFESQNKKSTMNNNAKRFAETLVSLKENNLPGIIYSFLVKFNKDNPKILEQVATNGLALAKRSNDPIHIMARIRDLLSLKPFVNIKDDRFLKLLYDEKRALVEVTKNYDKAKIRYKTVSREIHPKENYEQLLCGVKIKIAKFLLDKDPHLAHKELIEAKDIAIKINEEGCLNKINKLLDLLGD